MAFTHHFKPAHKEIKAYYEALASCAGHQVAHNGSALDSVMIVNAFPAEYAA